MTRFGFFLVCFATAPCNRATVFVGMQHRFMPADRRTRLCNRWENEYLFWTAMRELRPFFWLTLSDSFFSVVLSFPLVLPVFFFHLLMYQPSSSFPQLFLPSFPLFFSPFILNVFSLGNHAVNRPNNKKNFPRIHTKDTRNRELRKMGLETW